MGCSKSSSKWEVYSNTSLPQKTSKKYQIKHQINLNLTLKATRKNNKQTKITQIRRKEIVKSQSRNK